MRSRAFFSANALVLRLYHQDQQHCAACWIVILHRFLTHHEQILMKNRIIQRFQFACTCDWQTGTASYRVTRTHLKKKQFSLLEVLCLQNCYFYPLNRLTRHQASGCNLVPKHIVIASCHQQLLLKTTLRPDYFNPFFSSGKQKHLKPKWRDYRTEA